jgi:hypothetical protein
MPRHPEGSPMPEQSPDIDPMVQMLIKGVDLTDPEAIKRKILELQEENDKTKKEITDKYEEMEKGPIGDGSDMDYIAEMRWEMHHAEEAIRILESKLK